MIQPMMMLMRKNMSMISFGTRARLSGLVV